MSVLESAEKERGLKATDSALLTSSMVCNCALLQRAHRMFRVDAQPDGNQPQAMEMSAILLKY